jgi:glyoxylate/hydroxypyruvate reductase A
MRIACYFPAQMDSGPWLEAIKTRMPFQADVEAWHPNSPAADYAVAWQPAQAFFDAQPRLKAIFAAGAGVDALLALKLPEGVPVFRLEDAGMAAQMAEYIAFAALRHYREFDRYEAHAAQGNWVRHPPRPLGDYPVGLLGYGVLGQPVARALQSLGFAVHAWARTQRSPAGLRLFSGSAGLSEFLNATRILVCMLPLTAQTQDIICRKTLEQLKPGAYFINVARGRHVVEDDLLEALNNGQLAGATLDVCRDEPAPAGHPFWNHPKILLTPHIAATTLLDEAVAQIVANIDALERGNEASGRVDRRLGY